MNVPLTSLTVSLIIIFLAFGLSNAFVYNNNNIPCGTSDPLSLTSWVLGTAISYSILGLLFLVSLIFVLAFDQPIILLITAIITLPYSIAWTAIGSVVVFMNGFGCSSTNVAIWTVSVATIVTYYAVIPVAFILSILIVCNL